MNEQKTKPEQEKRRRGWMIALLVAVAVLISAAAVVITLDGRHVRFHVIGAPEMTIGYRQSFRDPGCTATSNGKLFGEGKYPLTVTVEGEVENSVLFRSVRVEKGAVVKNCVIMDKCVIKAGTYLENVICDRSVTVTADTRIQGTAESPCVLPKGGVI